MTILHLQQAKELRKHGARLGRAGMSQYIIKAVNEFNENEDVSYLAAIKLAGKLHALALASKSDDYWHEKMSIGYEDALHEISIFEKDK